MQKYVLTRTGETEPFDQKRIYEAIKKAAKGEMKSADVQYIVNEVKDFFEDDAEIAVEDIQNEVENALMHSRFPDVAREYVRYRQRHEMRRNASAELMEEYNDLLFTDPRDMDLKRDNANINTDAPMGIMLKLGTEGAKSYVYNYFMPEDVAKACKDGILHYHDADFSLITFNCLQTRLAKVLKGGFNTGHGFLREPNSIRAAAALTAISIQSSQNDLFGGQAINAFDYDLAPYVNKSFCRAIHDAIDEWYEFSGKEKPAIWEVFFENQYEYGNDEKNRKLIDSAIKHTAPLDISDEEIDKIISIATEKTKDETHQAMEAFIHNMNTLHSRAGRMCA